MGKQGILVIKFPGFLLECRILPLGSHEFRGEER